MNNPVSFELAKLLEEKGFDEPCPNLYYQPERCKKPTIGDVVMWLYEKHNIWIMVNNWKEHVLDDDDNILEKTHLFTWFITGEAEERTFNSPIEAYEAGIEYILTKLI